MRKDVPEKTSLHQGRTELMGTGVPEVIVLEARAALGILRASERKRENILLSILGLIMFFYVADSYNLQNDLV